MSSKQHELSSPRRTMTVREFAGEIGISLPTAYGVIRRGDVPALRIGHRVFVTRATVEALIERASRIDGDDR